MQTTKEGLSDINTLSIKPQHQVKSVLRHGYRARANACSYTATALATTAVTTMSKMMRAKSESMGAKHVLNSQQTEDILALNLLLLFACY